MFRGFPAKGHTVTGLPPDNPTLRVRLGSDGVFYVAGELDIASVDEFRAGVSPCLDGNDEVVLDLSELVFVDVIGIRAFLGLAEQIRPRTVVLRTPRRNVARVLDILHVGTLGLRVDENDPADGPGAQAPGGRSAL